MPGAAPVRRVRGGRVAVSVRCRRRRRPAQICACEDRFRISVKGVDLQVRAVVRYRRRVCADYRQFRVNAPRAGRQQPSPNCQQLSSADAAVLVECLNNTKRFF